jgi:hypothetical protein
MTDVPPPHDPRDEPYYDPRRRDDRDDRDGGHGWQLVAVGLIALLIGGGAAYLITDDGDSEPEVRTVQRESQTVTVQAAPSATGVTVTQPPAETVTKTTTLTVTVPTTTTTATEP